MRKLPSIMVSRPSTPSVEDCACPDSGFVSLPPSLAADQVPWVIAPDLYRAPLPDQHELVFDPFGLSNVVVLDPSARLVLDAYATPHHRDQLPSQLALPAAEAMALADQLAALSLLRPVTYTSQPLRTQPQTLTAWLHVTNACNLRCTYCYVNKTDEPMDETTGRAAVDAIFRSAVQNAFQAIKLKYSGGEATLNMPLVEKLHSYAQTIAISQGLALDGVVLSNGVALTPKMLTWMRDNKVRLMISLDGIGEAHDTQRIFINGRGSFTQVVHGIDRAIQHGIRPDLSITVTARSAGTLADVVAFALDRRLRFNLNFYREHDCAATISSLSADHERIIEGMRAAFAMIEAYLPEERLIDGLVDRSAFHQPHEYVCGAGHSYLVIDQRGRVARCQMELERPITTVQSDDPLTTIRLESTAPRNVSVHAKEGCRTCSWRYWCAGGCPVLTFRAMGRADVRSPYCHVYQSLYPDVLRLEGLRLLKWSPV